MIRTIALLAITLSLSSCARIGNVFNPFYDPPSPRAMLGERSDAALQEEGQGGGSAKARAALEAMATYQRANAPQPVNPVIQPAVVRLMWIPDHLNSHGDLVPAHYYYLKVKQDTWAVTDAFELESQLGASTGNASSIGYVNPEDVR